MEFKEILREILSESGKTQTELAKKINVKPSQISEWLRGKANPGYETLRNMIIGLDISPNYLLGLEDDFGVMTASPMREEGATEQERELLKNFRKLSPYLKEIALNTVQGLTGAKNDDLHKRA